MGDDGIKRSCKYCGGTHEEGYICEKKPKKSKETNEIVRFRSSPKWQKKRKRIKERDHYLCQMCIRDLYGTKVRYNYDDVQVHHAVPIHEDEGLKFESSNLITLCPMHHTMCESGEITYSEVKRIIDEQESIKESETCW